MFLQPHLTDQIRVEWGWISWGKVILGKHTFSGVLLWPILNISLQTPVSIHFPHCHQTKAHSRASLPLFVHTIIFQFLFCFFVLGILVVFREYHGGAQGIYRVSGMDMGYPCARQMSYPVYYLPGPQGYIIKTFQKLFKFLK